MSEKPKPTPDEIAKQEATVGRIITGLRQLIPEVRQGPVLVLKEGAHVKQNGREVTVYSAIAVKPAAQKGMYRTLTWTDAFRFGRGVGKLAPFAQIRAPRSALDTTLGELLNQRSSEFSE